MTTTVQWWSTVLAGDDGTLSTTGQGERYVALPSRSHARVVIDATNNDAIRDAAERMISSRNLPGSRRLAHVATAAVPRLAQSWLASNHGAQTLRDHLRDVLEAQVTLSIAIGPPRPNQKPVIRIYDGPDVVAIAKMGPDPHTASMVANEAHRLGELQVGPISDVLTADVLHHGRFGTSELLVMSRLPLRDDVGVPFSEVPNELLDPMSKRQASVGLGESDYWTSLLARAEPFADSDLTDVLQRVEAHPRFDAVETGVWHGDWSPWNIGRSTADGWCIWDWERSAVGAPLAADLLHLHLQYGPDGILGGLDGAAAASRALGQPEADFGLASTVYFAELLVRHHEADQSRSSRDMKVRQLVAARADIA